MLDGQIDMKGTLAELKARGALEVLEKDKHLVQKQSDLKLEETAIDDTAKGTKRPRQLVKEETRQVGSIKWKTYKAYMKATSYYTWWALAFGIILGQVLGVSEKLWIKQWGEVSVLSRLLHRTHFNIGIH